MIIDHNKKFLFIAIPKTGSTSIKRRFNILKDPPPEQNHINLEEVLDLKPETKNYFKFCFVRNPYDRLVSAYYDLKSSPGHLQWSYPILKYKNFSEFVVNLNTSPCKKFVHLLPQNHFIKTESSNHSIDFVGRFENLENDFKKVERKLNIAHRPLPHKRKMKDQIKKKFDLKKILSKLNFFKTKLPHYMSEYTLETKDICYQIYKKDFEKFGYEK